MLLLSKESSFASLFSTLNPSQMLPWGLTEEGGWPRAPP